LSGEEQADVEDRFDGDADEAAKFYVSLSPESRIDKIAQHRRRTFRLGAMQRIEQRCAIAHRRIQRWSAAEIPGLVFSTVPR
jgi:hypothetical protein